MNRHHLFCLRFDFRRYVMAGVAFSCLILPAYAATTTATPDSSPASPPIDLIANELEYDDQRQLITAIGQVEIAQDGRILKADRVVYNLQDEKVYAIGNVAVLDKNGDVHFSDESELSRDMRDGFIRKLRSTLADGSRLTAENVTRRDGKPVKLKQATYTPCIPCKANPDKPPLWQIQSDKVVYDPDKKELEYRDATFDIAGVPVLYTPYFKHSVESVEQESGFLPPKFALNSRLGFSVTPTYYWAIDPYQDATFSLRTFSRQAPLGLIEYRRRFEDAEIEMVASGTYSNRPTSVNGKTIIEQDQGRGHFEGKGLWNIDENWRAGFKTKLVSDDQYLRQYDISNEDVLRNEVYVERFQDRDYLAVRSLAFQDVRVSNRASDQPNIIPEVIYSLYGKPGATFGGRWNFEASALGLARKGNGQDVVRTSLNGGWERRDVTKVGIVNTFNAAARADIYNVPQRDQALSAGQNTDSTSTRLFPSLHNVTTLPFEKQVSETRHAIIEPTVALTLSPRVKNNADIPNEDSQDVQLDAANFFRADRFPGVDRVEDRSNAVYGVRSGLYDNDGSQLEVFVGQSYRFNDGDNPFPKGSGLETQASNYVGQVTTRYKDQLDLDYRFQLSSDTLSSQRHEATAATKFGPVQTTVNYLYSRELEGTDLTDSREQVSGGVDYEFVEDWHARFGGRYDLSRENDGLRDINIGLDYKGQCLTFSTTARRSYSVDESGDSGTEILLSLGFKNLGAVGTGSQ
jgi:LPS-assembly protein